MPASPPRSRAWTRNRLENRRFPVRGAAACLARVATRRLYYTPVDRLSRPSGRAPVARASASAAIGATNPATITGKGARVTQRATSLRWRLAAAAGLAAVLAASSPADAYIGPGAGFAVLGSFAVLFATTLIAGFAMLAWPFRMLWRMIRRRSRTKPLVRRLIFVGFDGQDATITERLMAEGKLPELLEARRARRLPAPAHDLPVGHAGRVVELHDRHQPRPPQHLRLPRPRSADLPAAAVLDPHRLGRPGAQARQAAHPARRSPPSACSASPSPGGRSSASTTCGARSSGSRSPSRRTPSTAPSSAPCASRTCSAPRGPSSCSRTTARVDRLPGRRHPAAARALRRHPHRIASRGPTTASSTAARRWSCRSRSRSTGAPASARVAVDGEELQPRAPGELSGWVTLRFPAIASVKVTGLARMMVTELDEHCSLYVSPVNIEPGEAGDADLPPAATTRPT